MTTETSVTPVCSAHPDCKAPVRFVRHTQFAGSHPFCSDHAAMEQDFVSNLGEWVDLAPTQPRPRLNPTKSLVTDLNGMVASYYKQKLEPYWAMTDSALMAELAKKSAIRKIDIPSDFNPIYSDSDSIVLSQIFKISLKFESNEVKIRSDIVPSALSVELNGVSSDSYGYLKKAIVVYIAANLVF